MYVCIYIYIYIHAHLYIGPGAHRPADVLGRSERPVHVRGRGGDGRLQGVWTVNASIIFAAR